MQPLKFLSSVENLIPFQETRKEKIGPHNENWKKIEE